LDRILPNLLAIYVVLLPIPRPVFLVQHGLGKAVYPSDVVFVAAVLIAALTRRFRRCDVALCGAALLPVLVVFSSAGIHGFGGTAVRDVLRVCYSMLVLGVMAHVRLDRTEIRRLLAVWVAWASVLALTAIVAEVAVLLFGWEPSALARADSRLLGPAIVRLHGPLEANAFVLYLSIAIATTFWLAGHMRHPHVWYCSFAVLVIAVPFTLSRGIAGLLVTIALLVCQASDQFPRLWRLRVPLVASALAVALVAAALTVRAILPIERNAAGRLRINTAESFYYVLHRAALRMLVARPLTGVGIGRFGMELPRYTSREERVNAWVRVADGRDWDPHSTWLGWAAECGIPGVLAWAVVFGYITHRLLAGKEAPLGFPAVAAAVIAGLVVNGLHVEISHLKFIWAYLGLALSVPRGELGASTTPSSTPASAGSALAASPSGTPRHT
jgi:O-antigen ligase